MPIGPTLETERLILRPPAAQDCDAWVKFSADSDVMEHLGGVVAPEVAWRQMATMTGAWVIGGAAMFSVIEKSTGHWLGRVGPWCPHGWPGTEIGWGLARGAWGQGYAVEAASATMDYVVDVLGWTEIIHTIAPGNDASVKVAERLGSRKLRQTDMPPPFEGYVCDVHGQTADDWRARRG